jgi:hypothetical protein
MARISFVQRCDDPPPYLGTPIPRPALRGTLIYRREIIRTRARSKNGGAVRPSFAYEPAG